MRVKLISVANRLQRGITVNDTSTEFYDTICNTLYSSRVTAISSQIFIEDIGNELFYEGIIINYVTHKTSRKECYNIIIGSIMFTPSKITRVCAAPELPPTQQGRVNISWDLLPCHLTNGADVRDCIIEYSSPSGDKRNVSTSEIRMQTACHPEYDHRYRCLLSDPWLLQNGVTYTFRVAARNTYGVRPFSDLVVGMIGITSIVNHCCNYGKHCGCSCVYYNM